MVSEPRRNTYAGAVSGVGETSQGVRPSSPIARSPAQSASTAVPQRNLFSQRIHSSEDLENPLFLSVNENPCAILVSPPLTGASNYSSWSISMQIALEVKNKWSIVDGSFVIPEISHSDYPAWRRCNLMVCSWIFKSVHSSIAQSIMRMDKAKDVWEDLKRRFAQRDAHRISALQNEIYSLKQGVMSVNDYYTRSKTLWEEMSALRPLPLCKCNPRCSCDLIDEIRKDRETDQIIRFLQGLNDDYSNLKSGILVLDPLPEMHKVFVMAEKLERQLNLESGKQRTVTTELDTWKRLKSPPSVNINTHTLRTTFLTRFFFHIGFF